MKERSVEGKCEAKLKGKNIDSRVAAIEGDREGLSTGCVVLERLKFLPSAPVR